MVTSVQIEWMFTLRRARSDGSSAPEPDSHSTPRAWVALRHAEAPSLVAPEAVAASVALASDPVLTRRSAVVCLRCAALRSSCIVTSLPARSGWFRLQTMSRPPGRDAAQSASDESRYPGQQFCLRSESRYVVAGEGLQVGHDGSTSTCAWSACVGGVVRRRAPPNKGMKQTSVEHIGRSQLIPGVRRTEPVSRDLRGELWATAGATAIWLSQPS